MSKPKPQPVQLDRFITGCPRWVPGKGRGGGCSLPAGHNGACVAITGGGR